ncbi:four-carbon acid sugar kinase family protein [Aquamicrobium ahrensii]|uniref:Uncharacterized protein YgbK (DUF1537 family) n=1 Tax=Aquamicrobium ahrensii TaxID=469551 RepID=A0ABV2KPS7_9HYPH
MAASLFVGVPNGEATTTEAGVVALKTRSPPAEAVRQSLQALDRLLRQGAEQIFFKYCSTFDSTPEGNIGPVAEALSQALGAGVSVVCPAFPATGRTLYQGHLFVGERLLNESGMEKHPLTPMIDPDIRRWLRRQIRSEVTLVPYPTARQGAGVDLRLKLRLMHLVISNELHETEVQRLTLQMGLRRGFVTLKMRLIDRSIDRNLAHDRILGLPRSRRQP